MEIINRQHYRVRQSRQSPKQFEDDLESAKRKKIVSVICGHNRERKAKIMRYSQFEALDKTNQAVSSQFCKHNRQSAKMPLRKKSFGQVCSSLQLKIPDPLPKPQDGDGICCPNWHNSIPADQFGSNQRTGIQALIQSIMARVKF